jgi:hypothetical protein
MTDNDEKKQFGINYSQIYAPACICGQDSVVWRTYSFCSTCEAILKKAVVLLVDNNITKGFGVFDKSTGKFLYNWTRGVTLCLVSFFFVSSVFILYIYL